MADEGFMIRIARQVSGKRVTGGLVVTVHKVPPQDVFTRCCREAFSQGAAARRFHAALT